MGIKLMLNLALRENYVFCDPNAPLHLSLGEPLGHSQVLTDSILRGLIAGTLIDIDGVVDIKNRKIIDTEKEREAEKVALEEAEKLALKEAEELALKEAEKLALEKSEKLAAEEAVAKSTTKKKVTTK